MLVQEFIEKNEVKMTSERLSSVPKCGDKWLDSATHYECTITCKNNSLKITYHHGSAIKHAPLIEDVLWNLSRDSSIKDMSFEDFCNEFGYDTDSRRAFSAYEQCKKQAENMAWLFEDKFNEFLSIEEE